MRGTIPLYLVTRHVGPKNRNGGIWLQTGFQLHSNRRSRMHARDAAARLAATWMGGMCTLANDVPLFCK